MPTDLPPYVTLMQATAWIMFRDVRVVAAGDPLPTEPAARAAEMAWRAENGGWLSLPGNTGSLQLIGLDVFHIERAGWPAELTPDPNRRSSEQAIQELLAALRVGRAVAWCRHGNNARSETMPMMEWVSLMIAEPLHEQHRLAVMVPYEGEPWREADWHDVRIERDGLLRFWPADWGASAMRARNAPLALASGHPAAPTMPTRQGFIWAADALRLMAFGEVVTPHPTGMDPTVGLTLIDAASRRLCGALANKKLTATGRPGRWHSHAVKGSPAPMPDAFFADPAVTLNLASWACAYDDAQSVERYVEWTSADAPDWAEVQFRRVDIEALIPRPVPTLEAATAWMRARGKGVKKQMEPDCQKATGCSREVARDAYTAAFGAADIGRPRKSR